MKCEKYISRLLPCTVDGKRFTIYISNNKRGKGYVVYVMLRRLCSSVYGVLICFCGPLSYIEYYPFLSTVQYVEAKRLYTAVFNFISTNGIGKSPS